MLEESKRMSLICDQIRKDEEERNAHIKREEEAEKVR
jgi:hypothetical protein